MTGRIKVKTADLTGTALDWAVAIATIGEVLVYPHGGLCPPEGTISLNEDDGTMWTNIGGFHHGDQWRPSTDWSQGGPLIEKYRVQLEPGSAWAAKTDCGGGFTSYVEAPGHTALIAACRAIVACKLGETVQVPKELMP